MNRAFYIVNIVLSFVFFFVCAYYIAEVSKAQFEEYMSYSNPDLALYLSDYSTGTYSSITREAAIVSVFFILSFLVGDLLGVLKVKTKTMKVMGIIGLSVSGIFLLWDFAIMASPGALSFDEVGGAFMFYSIIMIAFSIIGLIQSIRFIKHKSKQVVYRSADLLDS